MRRKVVGNDGRQVALLSSVTGDAWVQISQSLSPMACDRKADSGVSESGIPLAAMWRAELVLR